VCLYFVFCLTGILSTEASEEEEGWGGHGPKMGRSAIEEEEVEEEFYTMLQYGGS
jgi:hypothetical protein